MNHLAHCLLSFDQPEVLLGNFIGDFVKGRQWECYPPGVQKGVHLHRHIDSFTDAHPLSQESVRQLRPLSARYSAAVLDILYDHLLYRNWSRFGREPFDEFADRVFASLQAHHELMPDPLVQRWPRMLADRFLYAYTSPEALGSVLEHFVRRLGLPTDANALVQLFFSEITVFEDRFIRFFPELAASAGQKLDELA